MRPLACSAGARPFFLALIRNSRAPELRDGAGDRALGGLAEVAARSRALLEVNPGTEAALRLARRAEPAPQGIRVPFVDLQIFADELASYGPEVRVVGPEPLREAVVERLRATVVANGDVS